MEIKIITNAIYLAQRNEEDNEVYSNLIIFVASRRGNKRDEMAVLFLKKRRSKRGHPLIFQNLVHFVRNG